MLRVKAAAGRLGTIVSPIGHLQYGWWFAHWGKFSRLERAAITLAGVSPDLDGLTLFAGADAFDSYHHILFHNVGFVLGVAVVAGLLFWRRPVVWALVVFASATHVLEDYVTVGWNQYPWKPFDASVVNLANHLPVWLVQGVFQVAAMLFILAMTVWIYVRYRRTPIEILSPALDRLLLNYAVLPWRNRCTQCAQRAHFQCDACGQTLCGNHARFSVGLKPLCPACTA